MDRAALQRQGAFELSAKAPQWKDYEAGISLRSYQQRALERFAEKRVEGRSRFYLVAPPGAGKTLMGLLMASEFGEPALCLSPNAAIQGQWLDRLRQHWVCLDSVAERFAPYPACGDEATDEAQALIALTYQKISVRSRGEEESAEEGLQLHANVEALHTMLKGQGVRTLLLDECHHLSGHWGAAVEALVSALDNPFVIGLTATPLERAPGPLTRLLGEPDHVISLPSVVRAGDLAPFQDLCHVVAPSADEEEDIHAAQGRFIRLEQRLSERSEERFALASFWEMVEMEPALLGYDDLLELLAEAPDLAAAWCRFLVSKGQEPPAVMPYLPEAREPPTLGDRLLLVAHYLAFHLLVERPDDALSAEASETLEEWGYQLRPGRVRRKPGRLSRLVGFSRQKLRAAAEILATEITTMGDELRVLVITDYENPPAGRRALSCVDVMELLTSEPVLDELDPILITGSSLLVDDDLWDRFHQRCAEHCAREALQLEIEREAEAGYWRLTAKGADATTRVLVRLVTLMLEDGISRCLVGTRSLLGEGWDCLRLNTLIDLTVVTSGVAVNQIRGRTMRQDPDAPLKIANNWDVLCLSSIGDPTELQRLHHRHDKLYGITDDGQVERGIGHIHASFDRVSTWQLYAEREDLNVMMHSRAGDRSGAWQRWRVGTPWDDHELRMLSFSPPRKRGEPVDADAEQKEAAPSKPGAMHSDVLVSPTARRRSRRRATSTVAVGAAAASVLGLLGIVFWPPLALGALLPAAGALWRVRALGRRPQPVQLSDDLASLARVLLTAEKKKRADVEVTRRDDGTLRVVWKGLDPEETERMTLALAELLGPVVGQRYLIEEPLWRLEGGGLAAAWAKGAVERRVFGVPRSMGKASEAKRLLSCWQDLRNPDALLRHRDSEEGRALLADRLYQTPLSGEAAIREVWR